MKLTLPPSLFQQDDVDIAIVNIQKFAGLAEKMGLVVELGFSGGKDSVVIYDLAKKSGINFISVFNYAFEDPEVVSFIRECYPYVLITKRQKSYFQLIKEKAFLPTQQIRYCCDYFKEHSQNAMITGVRRAESKARQTRRLFCSSKSFNRTNKDFDIFKAECREVYRGEIQLKPIVNWSDSDVWNYIKTNNLPYPKLYDDGQKRCGCMLCPLASLKNNLYYFRKYPKLINVIKTFENVSHCFIRKTQTQYTAEQFVFIWLNRFKHPSKKDIQEINRIYGREIFETNHQPKNTI